MPDLFLNIRDDLAGVDLVPAAVEVFGRDAKLYDEVAGKVHRLGFASFFTPESQQGGLIVSHDDPGV